MSNTMISVRIPEDLLKEFKEIADKDHYMDLSEAVRSIIRKNWLQQKDPASYQLKQLRKDIADNVAKKGQEELIEELKKIRDSILEKREL